MSDAKTLSLTIGERLAALKMFDAFKGSVTALASLMDDIKQFPISSEEWETAKLVKTPNADGTEQWNWDDTGVKEITVQESTLTYLVDEIKKKSDAGEVTLADLALVTLEKKL